MTVRFYAGCDDQGHPWLPDYEHEGRALYEIAKQLWLKLNNQQQLYVLVANLRDPSADLVLLSERGIGVLELKHHSGEIHRVGNAWYAGNVRIKAGTGDKYGNPHKQVQCYATRIREKLIGVSPGEHWLPGRLYEQKKFKFNTAVCFTHPDAGITSLKESVERSRRGTRPWELFTVLRPVDVPTWARLRLRFQVDRGPAYDYAPYTLRTDHMVQIVDQALGATESTGIYELMPTGEPYGYLMLIEGEQRIQTFRLDQECLTLGRDADIRIPERFGRVSRTHARIKRDMDGIWIEDLGSTHKTFVNGAKIRKPRLLVHLTEITLGGRDRTPKVCLLVFSERPPKPGGTEAVTGGA